MSYMKFEEDTPKSFDLGSITKGITSIIQSIRLRSNIAFNYTYENDGRDVVNGKEVTADGSETSYRFHYHGTDNRTPSYSFEKSYFHSIITFIGLPSRNGDSGFTWLQLGRNLIGGWNPLPRKGNGDLDWANFNSKNWLNILGSIFLIKTILIPVIKLTTWPFKWAINFLKFGTEDLPLTLKGVSEDLSNYMYKSCSSVWNAKQEPFDLRHPAFFGFVKLAKLAIFGSLFLGSYLSNWAFSIVHKFGMALTSPDKSRRYWFKQGLILSQTTVLGYIPGSSYILPYILSGLSIAFSTLAWAVTFPLAVSAVTTFFPAVLPVVTSLTKLPFIAASLSMINGTVIYVSTMIVGIFAPALVAINVIATSVGIQITATSLAIGFTLGAVAAFSSIVLTYIADKTSNMWAIFKGTDTFEIQKDEIELARVNTTNIDRVIQEVKQGLNTFDNDFIDAVIKVIFHPKYSLKLEDSCNLAAEAIRKFLNSKPLNEHTMFAAAIEQKIYSHHNKPDFKNNLKVLEKQLKIKFNLPHDSPSNWKDIIHGANYTKVIGARATELQVNFDSQAPIDTKSRQQESAVDNSNDPASRVAAATTGTTFFTNSQQVLARSEKSALNSNLSVTHVMDSCLIAHKSYGYNASRRIYLAIADGLGGHTGDKAEDTRISRASYFGCKHAIRLCSTYDDADTLKANLKTIIKNVGDEILLKNKGQRESTSLTCATVFPVSEGWGRSQRVIGANIGDSMLVAWNPKTNTVSTLLPGRHLVQNIGQGPAHLPANYNLETDLDMVDVTLEQGTVLIPFTDGMLGSFNTITKQETRNGIDYNVYEIDPKWIVPILSGLAPNASAKEIVATLMQHVMAQAESDRRTLNQEAETAKTDLAQVEKVQKLAREAISGNRRQIDVQFQAFFEMKQNGAMTEEEYQPLKARLQEQKEALKRQEDVLNAQISELDYKTQIRSGDDIAVMAVRL